ncbi:MAG: UTP--glucose-1-phosphate uridylyltransferase GalU [Magnetococcus sp. WYHC-3]
MPVAGLGTRFLPATKSMPKEMLSIVDKPLIQYAVEEAWAAGIEQVIFVTGRGKSSLEDHFDAAPELENILGDRGKNQQLSEVRSMVSESGRLVYTRQVEPLGLGHAVLCARDLVGNEPFAVLLADDLVDAEVPVMKQMVEQFQDLRTSMVAVMEVARHDTDKYGIIDPEWERGPITRVRGLVEKPSPEAAPSALAIIGRYILMPEIFDLLGRQNRGAGDEIQLTDSMAGLLVRQAIYAYRFQGTRYDCGDKSGFQMANLALAMKRPQMRERLLPFLRQTLAAWDSSPSSAPGL